MKALKVELQHMDGALIPEQRLFLSVIIQALDDACMTDARIKKLRNPEQRDAAVRNRADARRYFGRQAFSDHCDILSIDPEWLLGKLARVYPWAREIYRRQYRAMAA